MLYLYIELQLLLFLHKTQLHTPSPAVPHWMCKYFPTFRMDQQSKCVHLDLYLYTSIKDILTMELSNILGNVKSWVVQWMTDLLCRWLSTKGLWQSTDLPILRPVPSSMSSSVWPPLTGLCRSTSRERTPFLCLLSATCRLPANPTFRWKLHKEQILHQVKFYGKATWHYLKMSYMVLN